MGTNAFDLKKFVFPAIAFVVVLTVLLPVGWFIGKTAMSNRGNAQARKDWNFTCNQMPVIEKVRAVLKDNQQEVEQIISDIGGEISIISVGARDKYGSFCGETKGMVLARYGSYNQVKELQAFFHENKFHGIPVKISSFW